MKNIEKRMKQFHKENEDIETALKCINDFLDRIIKPKKDYEIVIDLENKKIIKEYKK